MIEVKRGFYMKYVKVFKWLSVILVIAVMIPAIGCGKKEAQEPTPTPTAIPTATTPAEPTGETGSLSSLTGDVQVLRQSAVAWIMAASGMKIWTGDSLKTGSDGYVLITFFDGSVMEVEADSEISVEELNVASGGSTTVRINQVIGNTVNRVENLIDSSSTYEVETLAGSAVVRGTIYRIQVNQYGEITHTCTSTLDEEDKEEHSADFSNGGKTVEVPEGMTSCGWEGGVPGDPFYTDPADDPLQGSSGEGGQQPSCGPECWRGEKGEVNGFFVVGYQSCICECCCMYPYIWLEEEGVCSYNEPVCQDYGYSCETNGDCCSEYCSEGMCSQPCQDYGYSCEDNGECCSGHCYGGYCGSGN
jgi:hypothetical protein